MRLCHEVPSAPDMHAPDTPRSSGVHPPVVSPAPQPPRKFSPASIAAPQEGHPMANLVAALRAEATIGPVVVVTGRTAHG